MVFPSGSLHRHLFPVRVFKGCIEKVEFWKLWLKRLHPLSEGWRRWEICQRCQLYSSHQSEAPKHTSKTLEACSTKQDSRLEKKKPLGWETKRPSSYQNKSGFLNSTFKTMLKVLWWSVVQISVFAIAQVLTTVLNKTGFTSWVDNLHHRNFLVSLTGSRLIYIELDRTGPQSLVKAFIPFHFLMAGILQRTNRGPRVGASGDTVENSDQQFPDHVGGA